MAGAGLGLGALPVERVSGPPPRERLVRDTFAAWERLGLGFVVLRNYEHLPREFGHDIDVLLPRARRAEAEAALLSCAEQAGFRLINRVEMTVVALFFDHPMDRDVRFDLSWRLDWRGFAFYPEADVLSRRREHGTFHVPTASDETLIKLVQGLLYGGSVKPAYRGAISSVSAELALEALPPYFGSGLSRRLLKQTREESWEAVEALAPALRRALVFRRLLLAPLDTFSRLGSDALRLFGRLRRRTGLVIAFLGPDGAGKSTVIAAVRERLVDLYRDQRLLHWKPALIKRGDGAGPVTDPHAKPSRGMLLSVAYFVFHVTEYFVGGLFMIRLPAARNRLVLLDRYFHDFYVDRRRFRLRLSDWFVRLGHRFVPEPDMLFFLTADADTLLGRKAEVDREEVVRQVAAYRSMAKRTDDGADVQVSRPLDEIVDDIDRAIRAHLARRTGDRLTRRPNR